MGYWYRETRFVARRSRSCGRFHGLPEAALPEAAIKFLACLWIVGLHCSAMGHHKVCLLQNKKKFAVMLCGRYWLFFPDLSSIFYYTIFIRRLTYLQCWSYPFKNAPSKIKSSGMLKYPKSHLCVCFSLTVVIGQMVKKKIVHLISSWRLFKRSVQQYRLCNSLRAIYFWLLEFLCLNDHKKLL